MKTKGRRQSTNVEIRRKPAKIDNLVTPDDWLTNDEPFVTRDRLESNVHHSQHLRDRTPMKNQKMTNIDEHINQVHNTNPHITHGNKTREETAKPTRFKKTK